MTLQTRRIIFISLVILFLIITPLIIVYGIGYAFDWQKKDFVKTGSFYLKSAPSGAQIYINDNNKGKTNKYIKRLLPKEYQVALKREGYHSWVKNLKIESQVVTEARNILMVPENPKVEVVFDVLSTDFLLTEFLTKDDERQRTRLEQASTTAAQILKTKSYSLVDANIFYLDTDNYILYQSDLTGSASKQISRQPLPPGEYRIISQGSSRTAVLNKEGELYLLDPETYIFKKITDNVKGAELPLDGKKLLYWTDSEIWVIYLKKILIQPYKKEGEKELITRFSEKINSAIWYPEDNEHIIFVVGDTIKIAELDGRDKRNINDLVRVKNFETATWDRTLIGYSLDDQLLYFINDNKLFSLQIKTGQVFSEARKWFVYGK